MASLVKDDWRPLRMKTTRFLALVLCTISFICLYAANASSGGFAIAEQTAFGVGQGNAITAG